jgi:WD40 repeat protein
MVATSSWDGTVRLWTRNGTLIAVLSDHKNRVNSVEFSSDGRRIVTASDDGTARQYLIHTDDLLVAAACAVNRSLTQDEIQRYQVPEPLKLDFTHRECAQP